MQTITSEARDKIREIRAEIRNIDETIQENYNRIADYEASQYPKHCDTYDHDIAMREIDIQNMMLRRSDLTLKLRQITHTMSMRRRTY